MTFEGCCGTKLGGDAPEGDVACDEMMDAPTKREGGGCGVSWWWWFGGGFGEGESGGCVRAGQWSIVQKKLGDGCSARWLVVGSLPSPA